MVAGTVITLIDIWLLPVAIRWINGPSVKNIALALITLTITLLCNKFLTGFLNRLAPLTGLVGGTLAAWPLGAVNAKALTEAPVFSFTTRSCRWPS